MQEPLADGGVIRKLWIGEAARYRDHLLRLDQDSRHSRFGGGVSDEFIRNYVRTLLAARNRGIKALHMACLANNRRMQDLARKFAAELSFDFGDVVGEVAAARPTPLSVLREMVADNCGFATAVLDVQSRLLKTAA